MGMTLLLQGAAAAVSAGMGCGTCCGAGMGTALYSYLLTHAKGMKESLRAFLCFFLGKVMSTTALCVCASLIGSRILTEEGTMWGIPVRTVVDLVMILIGVGFLWKWNAERKGRSGTSCNHCESRNTLPEIHEKVIHLPVLWIMGFGYGITPCAPLLMIAGYSATLPFMYAAAVGCMFALCSAAVPLLILFLLTGAVAVRMYREIPQYLTWFRLGCYLLLTGLFAADLIRAGNPFQ